MPVTIFKNPLVEVCYYTERKKIVIESVLDSRGAIPLAYNNKIYIFGRGMCTNFYDTTILETDEIVRDTQYDPDAGFVVYKDRVIWCHEYEAAWNELLRSRVTSLQKTSIPTNVFDSNGKRRREQAYDVCIGDKITVTTLSTNEHKDAIAEIQRLLAERSIIAEPSVETC